jgi:hypothetical protein
MHQTGEVVTDIQFEKSGKLAHASRAAAAIKALPVSLCADQVELLERHREQWIYTVHGGDVSAHRPRPWARFALWAARDLLNILYSQIALLATALQEHQLKEKGTAISGQFYQEYLRMVEANRGFHAFLMEHYREKLSAAHAANRPLLDLSKEILISERDTLDRRTLAIEQQEKIQRETPR